MAATFLGVVSTTTSAWASSSSRVPATSTPALRIAARVSWVAANTGIPRPAAVRTCQSVAMSATPTRSMSGMSRTASATRFPITP
ncbi:hypothetical protein AVL62_15710 [Serinicoccus chungangensis]|uniref:Secreted protein n=1 Tax=Serinicoccus chungangensis TaxID=767452 RepID=A0A0W8IJD3_9MICO|nr:hypothetical protein AVL62_15710 [Serinicoccus chungangensis]